MKLSENQEARHQAVTAYDEEGIIINGVRFCENLLVLPDASPVSWTVPGIERLVPDDFSAIIAEQPDLLLIGTRGQHHLLSPQILVYLSSKKIGVETMNIHAACRTFNLLLSEGRRVALALFLGRTT